MKMAIAVIRETHTYIWTHCIGLHLKGNVLLRVVFLYKKGYKVYFN